MPAAFVSTPFISQSRNNTTYVKTYASNVGAGNLLWCFTLQYHASQTCTGVSDDVNGAWTKAFGPIRGSANVGDPCLYGFYKKNSAAGGFPTAGTVTATWSGSGNGSIYIGSNSGLAGGGDLDQVLFANPSGILSEVNMGTTATLEQAVEAAVGIAVGSNLAFATLDAAWTDDSNGAPYYYERLIRKITSTNAALNPKWTYSSTMYFALGMMSFKDAAVSVVSGGATLDDMSASGTLATAPAIALSGSATLGDMTASGAMGSTAGVLTTPVIKNNAGTVLASISNVTVNVYHPTSGALVAQFTGLSTNGSGVIVITSSFLSPSTTYAFEVDMSNATLGRRLPTALTTP